MMNPPNAGERNTLPRMATYGLQIVSPSGGCAVAGIDSVAGIDDPGPGAALGVPETAKGNGGGPAAGIGVAGNTAEMEGRGGGVARGASTGFGSVGAAAVL